jgi:hypothetical protein
LFPLTGTLLGLPDREKMTDDLALVWTAKRTSLARAAAA